MNIILADIKPEMCLAWEAEFLAVPSITSGTTIHEVEIINKPFQEIEEWDCLSTAANSFGRMGGGLDAAINAHFGGVLDLEIQALIKERWFGELPVGTSLLVKAVNQSWREPERFVAYTPTMRQPGTNISATLNAYLAMRGVLTTVERYNRNEDPWIPCILPIESIVIPGYGTGVGRMDPRMVAKQMFQAFTSVYS